MTNKLLRTFGPILAIAVAGMFVSQASASPRKPNPGVRYSAPSSKGGYQSLVSDGPGTGFGFHRLPLPYHIAAVRAHDRQSDAVHRAVADTALTSGSYHTGFLGDSVYGAGSGRAYGVFNGADGYGSPYFAGYYGPGGGADYGPFGHAYSN